MKKFFTNRFSRPDPAQDPPLQHQQQQTSFASALWRKQSNKIQQINPIIIDDTTTNIPLTLTFQQLQQEETSNSTATEITPILRQHFYNNDMYSEIEDTNCGPRKRVRFENQQDQQEEPIKHDKAEEDADFHSTTTTARNTGNNLASTSKIMVQLQPHPPQLFPFLLFEKPTVPMFYSGTFFIFGMNPLKYLNKILLVFFATDSITFMFPDDVHDVDHASAKNKLKDIIGKERIPIDLPSFRGMA